MECDIVFFTWKLGQFKSSLTSSKFVGGNMTWSLELTIIENSDDRNKDKAVLHLIKCRGGDFIQVNTKSKFTIRSSAGDLIHHSDISILKFKLTLGYWQEKCGEFCLNTQNMTLELRFHLIISKDNDVGPKYQEIFREIYRFLQNKKLCDTVITARGISFEVHQLILAVASPVFAAVLEACPQVGMIKYLNIDDFSAETMGRVLQYVYTREFDTTAINVKGTRKIFIAADRFALTDLRRKAADHLLFCVDDENSVKIAVLADVYKLPGLREKCLDVLCANVDKISVWDPESHLQTRPTIVSDMLLRLARKYKS